MKTSSAASLTLLLLSLGMAASAIPAHAVQPTAQPSGEAAAQSMLPKVHDALWSKLVKCEVSYDNKAGTFGIHITPEVKALDSQVITVRGFVLPMDGSDRTRHFLITRNTPVCQFCPPGEPNEVVEVRTPHAVEWTDQIMTVRRKLHLVNDEEKAFFFKIENAEVKQ